MGWNKGETKLSRGQFSAAQVDNSFTGLGVWSMGGLNDLFLLPHHVCLAMDIFWSAVSDVGTKSCPNLAISGTSDFLNLWSAHLGYLRPIKMIV